MGAGDAPWSYVERPQAGPLIGSGRGPMRIEGAAESPGFVGPGSAVPAIVARKRAPSRRAVAPARSRHRPVGSPFGPS